MDIERTNIDQVHVVRFSGAMDMDHYPQLKETIREIKEQDVRRVILNLSQVHTLSSSGVGALVELMRSLEMKQGALVLADLSPVCLDVLSLLRVEEFFTIAPDEDTALALLEE